VINALGQSEVKHLIGWESNTGNTSDQSLEANDTIKIPQSFANH
jgi:hypothetical protein